MGSMVILKRVQDDGSSPQTHFHSQIVPFGILALHQIDLPSAVPVFELLLAGDGLVHGGKYLDMDQPFAISAFGEAIEGALLVLVVSRCHVRGDADVDIPAIATG